MPKIVSTSGQANYIVNIILLDLILESISGNTLISTSLNWFSMMIITTVSIYFKRYFWVCPHCLIPQWQLRRHKWFAIVSETWRFLRYELNQDSKIYSLGTCSCRFFGKTRPKAETYTVTSCLQQNTHSKSLHKNTLWHCRSMTKP